MADDNLDKKCSTTDDVGIVSKGETALENPSSQDSKQLGITVDEETLIIRMYNLVGERWSLIAGRIPGRSAEEIEKYWNSKHPTSCESTNSAKVSSNKLTGMS